MYIEKIMGKRVFIKLDIQNEEHCKALVTLLNYYMEDEMGAGETMPESLGPQIIKGLKTHSAYLGFLVKQDQRYVALANCNLNYSNWQARFLINIHDLIVSPEFRGQGIGEFLLNGIEGYGKDMGYCKLNLEGNNDNHKAQRLYKRAGYREGDHPMLFWQKLL